jgi:cellulose synthase operon protein C
MSFAVVAALAVAAVPATRQGAAALAQPGRDPTLLHRHADQIVQAKDVEQEQALRRLLALGGNAAELAEVTQRLANLLRARALSLTIRAQAEADESDTSAAERDRAVAQAARTEAVQLYRQLLRKYPRAPRLDAALFFLADALQDSAKDAEAVTAARELVRKFPKSQWAPASHVFIGEHLFDEARLSEALAEYRAAAEVETDEVYPYALYKAGWCRFNQGAFGDAMKLLQKVVAVSLGGDSAHPDESGEPSKVQLAREARRDYVIAYARGGKPENARDDFAARFGLAPGRKMLEQYGKLLFDQGRDPEAQLVHRQLLEIHGDRSGAALDQTRLLMIAARGGKRKDLLREAQALVDVFHRVQKREAQKGDEAEQLEEARNHAEETLRNLAVSIHNEGRKTHLEDTWAAAKALYADYLTLFPDAPDAYDLRFFDAELLFGLGEKAKAADLYEEVVRQDLAAVQAGRSARRWLQQAAWDAVLARAQGAGDAARGVHGAQRPMTADEEKLARACALYLEVLPDGPHAVEVAFKLGRLEYVSGKLDEARKHLSWIALSHPEHELAEYAANLVLDIENLRKDYTAVRAWAKRFLANPRLVAHGRLQQDLTRVEEQSAYAMADAVQGDVAKAEALLAFVSEHPKGALADKAIFGAAAAYSRAGRIDDALAARARLWKEFPASTLVARALLASAADTATVGDFAESASLLERYFAGYRKEREARRKRAGDPMLRPSGSARRPAEPSASPIYEAERARAALHDAAVLREARGELQRALQDRQAAVQAWPQTADEAAQRQEIALLRARLGEPARAAREIAALARAAHGDAARISGWADAARLFTQVRETDHAQWAWAELEKAMRALPQKARDKLSPEALSAAAEAHLALGDATFDAFRKQAIKPPLAQTLARKIDLLQRVKKRAEETVALRQASPAVCALQRLGEAQMLLAQSIEQSPAPRELNSEQRKLYRAALADKARPLYDEARETLRAADGKAHELGVSGECVAHTVALLEKLGAKPGNRAQLDLPVEELSAVPDLVDATGRPAASDAEAVPRASVIERTAVGAPAAQVASQRPVNAGRGR